MKHSGPYKVVFLHRSLNQSGAVRQLINLYKGIDRDRFTPVFVLLRADRLFYREILEQPNTHILRTNNESLPQCWFRFLHLLRSESPDVVQSFDPTGNAMLYLASLFYNRPLYFGSVRNTNQKFRYNVLDYMFQSRVCRLVVNSLQTQEELIRKAGVRHKKITIIPNGVETDYFTPVDTQRRLELRRRYGIEDRTFILSSPGRIHTQKNHLLIVQALAVIRHRASIGRFKLFIIGRRQDLQLYNQMQSLIRQHALDPYVEFIEPTHAIRDYYHISDLIVLASLWEGLPNVVLEAMACARVVLMSEQADNDDIIQHGKNGFKFSVRSPELLADAILQIADLSQNTRDLIARKLAPAYSDGFHFQGWLPIFKTCIKIR